VADHPSTTPASTTPAGPPPTAAAESHAADLHVGADKDALAHGHGGHGGEGSRVEAWAIVVVALAMVLLPTVGAVVRRLTGQSLTFTMVYTQHLTLWIGFIGALLATARGSHLALSTLDMIPEGRWRDLARGYGNVLSAFVCAVLTFASTVMILADRGRQDKLEGGVPAFVFEVVMPIAFALMAVRFARMAPTRQARIVAWALVLLVVPFILSAGFASFGHPIGLNAPDGAALFGG
jgi:TRAP-type C4-dicarboxylate transport system permease small subunit